MKKILCVISRPPYRGSHTIELVETAMVGAVFDFSVSILFRDQGVWALASNQDASLLGKRTVGKVLSALPTYEIDTIYICKQSLQNSGLDFSSLILKSRPLDYSEQAILFSEQDAILGAQS